MAVKKKSQDMSKPITTIFFNAKKVKKDEEVINLALEYAPLVSKEMTAKQALAHFIKQCLPGAIRELRERMAATA